MQFPACFHHLFWRLKFTGRGKLSIKKRSRSSQENEKWLIQHTARKVDGPANSLSFKVVTTLLLSYPRSLTQKNVFQSIVRFCLLLFLQTKPCSGSPSQHSIAQHTAVNISPLQLKGKGCFGEQLHFAEHTSGQDRLC